MLGHIGPRALVRLLGCYTLDDREQIRDRLDRGRTLNWQSRLKKKYKPLILKDIDL
jgi:hypothetical protein